MWWLTVLGLVVVGITMTDFFRVTMAVGRPPKPLRANLSDWLWTALRRLTRRWHPRHGLGMLAALATLSLWILLVWAGWAMIFSGVPDAVVITQTGQPASGWERVYFAGSSLFSLGISEYRPNGTPWQLATVGAVLNGLTLLTLGITYLLQVITAATEKRQLAGVIQALGATPTDVVVTAWRSGAWSGLEQHLIALTAPLDLLTQRHLAYPVLHFFYSQDQRVGLPPAIALLDETLVLLEHAIAFPHGPNWMAYQPLRAIVGQFLATLEEGFIRPADLPPVPDLAPLRTVGIPTVDDAVFYQRVAEECHHRCLLHGLVSTSGWDWTNLWP
jgi:hypothetical protein